MAAHYIRELKTVQPHGPYRHRWTLCRRMGGVRDGAAARGGGRSGRPPDRRRCRAAGCSSPAAFAWSPISGVGYVLYGRSGRVLDAIRWNLSLRLQRLRNHSKAHDDVRRASAVRRRHADAHSRYEGGAIAADLTFIRSDEWAGLADKDWHLDWTRLTTGSTTTVTVPGTHAGLLTGQSERALAAAMRETLDR